MGADGRADGDRISVRADRGSRSRVIAILRMIASIARQHRLTNGVRNDDDNAHDTDARDGHAAARGRATGRGPGDVGWRRREAHARADAAAAAPARSVPDARRVRHRQSAGLHRRLSRPSASRLRDGHVHDRRPHAPSRQRRPRRAAAERRRAVDDRRPRRHPFRACPSRRTAGWKASSCGSISPRRTRCARLGIATSRAPEIPEFDDAGRRARCA